MQWRLIVGLRLGLKVRVRVKVRVKVRVMVRVNGHMHIRIVSECICKYQSMWSLNTIFILALSQEERNYFF